MSNKQNTQMLVIFILGIATCMYLICNKKETFQTNKPPSLIQCTKDYINDPIKANKILKQCKPMYDYEMSNLYNNDAGALLKCIQRGAGMNNKEVDEYKSKCHDSFLNDKQLRQSNHLLNCTRNNFTDNKLDKFGKVLNDCKPVYDYEMNNINDTNNQDEALSRCIQCTGKLTEKQYNDYRNKCKNDFFKDKSNHLKHKFDIFNNIM